MIFAHTFSITFLKSFAQFLYRSLLHFSEIVQGWCLPFPGSDRSVMMRSQRHFFHQEKQRPVQIQAYIKQNSLFAVLCLIIGGIIFGVFVQFRIGRYLLEKV